MTSCSWAKACGGPLGWVCSSATNPCRSELARDGDGSGDICVEGAGLIASKLAPTGFWCHAHICIPTPHHCRSGLARDGGVSGTKNVECARLIAGKPAPTGFWCHAHICIPTPHHCGSGLARDVGVSGTKNVGCAGLIASKLAPTGDLRCSWILCSTVISVGASLLAMAVGQATLMLNVLASSRASSLLQRERWVRRHRW